MARTLPLQFDGQTNERRLLPKSRVLSRTTTRPACVALVRTCAPAENEMIRFVHLQQRGLASG